jgi:hypothetical protein
MVDGEMRVTLRLDIPVRSSTIADNGSAEFDPRIYDGLQSFSGSVRNGNEKRSTGITLYTARHRLPLNGAAPVILAPTKFALNNFDDLVRTADLLRGALQVYEHGLSAELAPVRDRSWTEAMLFFDTFGRDAAYDVVCEKQNLLECEVTMLKP